MYMTSIETSLIATCAAFVACTAQISPDKFIFFYIISDKICWSFQVRNKSKQARSIYIVDYRYKQFITF